MTTRIGTLRRLAGPGAAMLLLAGCTVFNPSDALDVGGPVQPKRLSGSPMDSFAYDHFAAAFALANQDELAIKTAAAKPGVIAGTRSPPATGCKGLYLEWATPTDCYSPLDYQAVTDTDMRDLDGAVRRTTAQALAAGSAVLRAQTALDAAQKRAAVDNSPAATAAVATAAKALADAATRQAAATQAAEQAALRRDSTAIGDRKPGSSFQSIHARAMAQAGIALANQQCAKFFAVKADVQTWSSITNNAVSKVGSVVAGAVGAAGGAAAVPTSFSLANPFFSAGNDILNKDFLFGEANIGSVYRFVSVKLANNAAAALPEPDNSDWSFQRAVDTVLAHQTICRTENILSMLRENAAKIEVRDNGTDPATGAPRPSQGTGTTGTEAPK
jgi:hypothetical protein